MNSLTTDGASKCQPLESSDAELFVRPEVDIQETPTAYLLYAEMPGVGRDRLEVTVADDRLTITGRKQAAPSTVNSLLKETSASSFRRTFQLSPEIDRNGISAKVEQGLVTVTLKKAAKPEPRRIAVA